jgi:hypothetical protein
MTDSIQDKDRKRRRRFLDQLRRSRKRPGRPGRSDLYERDQLPLRQLEEIFAPDFDERYEQDLDSDERWSRPEAHFDRSYRPLEDVDSELYVPDSGWEREFTGSSGARSAASLEQEGVIGAPYGAHYGGRARGKDRTDFYVWTGHGEDREIWQLNGPYTGVGPKGYEPADERILEEVSERLTQHGQLDATDIEVSVQDGIVKLEGRVSDRRAKRMAEDTAESVAGVRDVHNHLRLNRSSERKLKRKLFYG